MSNISENYKYGDNSRTDKKIKQIIPILVQYARESWDVPHYYQDIAEEINDNPRNVGKYLGLIWSNVFQPLSRQVPTLNALICNKNTNLPSDGFNIVANEYESLSSEEKRKCVNEFNRAAHNFDWNPILKLLKITPRPVIDQSQNRVAIERGKNHHGGEGIHHNYLKNYVFNHPESVGIIDNIQSKQVEFELQSLDKIDVYFNTGTDIYSVEVKSYMSDDNDILRGIFQAVKYKTLLEAQNTIYGETSSVHSILVIQGSLNEELTRIARTLDINVIQKFKFS